MSKSSDVVIDTNDLRFIEGHGRLTVKQAGNEMIAEFQNLEGPRFLTKYLHGKPVEMAPLVASRICGLCYTAHSINSAECIERALGINVSKEVRELRNVLYLANNLRSHIMHLLYLSLPTIEGLMSVLRMRDKEVYNSGTRLLIKSTEMIEIWGGRSVHVPNVVIGGFGAVMKGKELIKSVNQLESLISDAKKFVDYVLKIDLPELERYRTLAALKIPGSYSIYSENAPVALNDGSIIESREYFSDLNEVTKDYSTSKHVYFRNSEVTVGALSRMILNRRYLSPGARELAEQIEWRVNPFLIIKAQAVEVLHYLEELLATGQRLGDIIIEPNTDGISNGNTCSLSQGDIPECTGSGSGVFIAEAPRGTLCHFCDIEEGMIKAYRVYTPTAVNSKSIEMDAIELVRRFRFLGMEKLKFVLEDMVRSYDPCLSCAVSLDVYD